VIVIPNDAHAVLIAIVHHEIVATIPLTIKKYHLAGVYDDVTEHATRIQAK